MADLPRNIPTFEKSIRTFMKKHLLPLFCLLAATVSSAADTIDLSGEWQFRTDSADEGVPAQWTLSDDWTETVRLPGSMPENLKGEIPSLATQWTGSIYDSSFYFNPAMEKYRQEGNVKFPFFLTPDRHYVGVAWYRREVVVPKDWRGKDITLYLERPHIETRVWVDGREVGKDSSLCVPHEFNLSRVLTPGRHRIALRIDNRIKEVNVGPDSHSVTDQTQGNWNGVVGRMQLRAREKIHFDDIQVFPDIRNRRALVRLTLANTGRSASAAVVSCGAESFNSEEADRTDVVSRTVDLPAGSTVTTELTLPFGEGMLLWNEFHPALYRLKAEVTCGRASDIKQVQFGMREISIDGRWICINGQKTLLRGTVENCCFPETGYAPMDVASWERVFRICKSYGLNHMRFHSFCPPEAAFIAADLTGMYLQPEGPSWPNHGSALGYGWPIDKYLMDETIRINKVYGNYASFCMLACGNEPRGRWVKWVSDFVDFWKATDPRHIYTGASVGGGWDWQPRSQYHVKAGARGLNWKGTRPESFSDFSRESSYYKGKPILEPFISHETGQWCAFPDLNGIKKYTGVYKARNFELFQEDLSDHDMADQATDFLMASGKLQLLCYKHEIEKTLRTPDYAGFQLLALNDYSGQGSALVGVLDVFWEEKGYATAADFRQFCAPTVPLIRTGKFVWKTDEVLHAEAEVAHFGERPLQGVSPVWRLKDANGRVCRQGRLSVADLAIGNGQRIGDIDIDLSFVGQAGRYTLELALEGADALNTWNFYVYPARVAVPSAGDIYITHSWNDTVRQVLDRGGDVLILANRTVTYGREIEQQFQPVFWNTSWFKMRPPHTTGILVNPHHPLFDGFPTDAHADFQWWEIVNRAPVMLLSDFPQGFRPLIQSIDTWFLNRKIGMLIEARVGKGRVVVTTADLESDLEARPAARQLYASLLSYMQSIRFRPAFEVDEDCIRDLFSKTAARHDTFSRSNPDELKPKQGGE